MKEAPYRILAKTYDWLFEPSAGILRRIGLQVFPPRDNISVLDVGCGTGTQLALYHKSRLQAVRIGYLPGHAGDGAPQTG